MALIPIIKLFFWLLKMSITISRQFWVRFPGNFNESSAVSSTVIETREERERTLWALKRNLCALQSILLAAVLINFAQTATMDEMSRKLRGIESVWLAGHQLEKSSGSRSAWVGLLLIGSQQHLLKWPQAGGEAGEAAARLQINTNCTSRSQILLHFRFYFTPGSLLATGTWDLHTRGRLVQWSHRWCWCWWWWWWCVRVCAF